MFSLVSASGRGSGVVAPSRGSSGIGVLDLREENMNESMMRILLVAYGFAATKGFGRFKKGSIFIFLWHLRVREGQKAVCLR